MELVTYYCNKQLKLKSKNHLPINLSRAYSAYAVRSEWWDSLRCPVRGMKKIPRCLCLGSFQGTPSIKLWWYSG